MTSKPQPTFRNKRKQHKDNRKCEKRLKSKLQLSILQLQTQIKIKLVFSTKIPIHIIRNEKKQIKRLESTLLSRMPLLSMLKQIMQQPEKHQNYLSILNRIIKVIV